MLIKYTFPENPSSSVSSEGKDLAIQIDVLMGFVVSFVCTYIRVLKGGILLKHSIYHDSCLGTTENNFVN